MDDGYQYEAINYIDDCNCSVDDKMKMLAEYCHHFDTNEEIWSLLKGLFIQNSQAVINQFIENNKDYFFALEIIDLNVYVDSDDLTIYEKIIKQLLKTLSKPAYKELEYYLVHKCQDNEIIKRLINDDI